MRLRELEIEQFGIFSQYQAAFSDSGLQVVFGANEAGKSTLLQLIRELLFGFAERNRYALGTHSGEMAATALVELADGKHIRYRRRKGRRNVIKGEYIDSGRAVDEAEWNRVLSGAGPELFENIFGFSLAELTAAEQSLKRANLREALYGGSLGGLANIQPVLDSLRAEHERLFTPTAKKRTINALLATIRTATRELTQAQLKPSEYKQLRKTAAELDDKVVAARALRESLQRQKAAGDRLMEAHALWVQRAPLRDQLTALDVPDAFPTDGARQYDQLRVRNEELSRELADFDAELQQIERRLEPLTPRTDIIARTAEIRRLLQQLEQIRGFRRDLRARQRESRSIKDQVLARLRALDPNWTFAQLESFQINVARRTKLELMEEQLEQLQTRQNEREARRPTLQADISSIQKRIEQLESTPVSNRLEQLVDTAPTYLANLEKRTEWQTQASDLDTRINTLTTRVATPFGLDPDRLLALPVPLRATLESFHQRWTRYEQTTIPNALLEQTRMKKELRSRQRKLNSLRAARQVPDRQELIDTRRQRDAGWQLIRRKFVEQQEIDASQWDQWLAGHEMDAADLYEQTVERADQVADHRQEHAETVARQDQLAAEVEELQRGVAEQAERVQAANDEFSRERAAWDELWQPCGLDPAPPDAMLEWAALHAEFVEVNANRTRLQAKLDRLADDIDQYEHTLRALLENASDDPASMLAEARRRVTAARDLATERKTYAVELPAKQRQLETLDNELAQIRQQHEQWQQEWDGLMREFGFPATWDVQTANRVIRGLTELRLENDKAESLDRRVADMQRGLDEFERGTAALCRELIPELNELPAEDAVEELGRLLDQARQDQQDQVTLLAQRDKLTMRIAAKKKQLDETRLARRRLFTLAGVDNEDDLLAVARRAEQRAVLQRQIELLSHQIEVLRGSDDPAAFARQLDATDAVALESESRVLETQLGEAEQQFAELLRAQALIAEQLRVLDQGSRAAELMLDVESARSELREAIDRWAPLVLAEQFMRQAIGQFEREHQPQLLLDVGDLFRRLTAGRYTAIRRKLDEEGSLLVESEDGQTKEPHQLSTGTREQLYLAMRLAYVLHYCRDAEPLPIIMDDVLVNFDDQRAVETLRVLGEVAAQVQVILLTCHDAVLAKVKQVDPGAEPIILGRQESLRKDADRQEDS